MRTPLARRFGSGAQQRLHNQSRLSGSGLFSEDILAFQLRNHAAQNVHGVRGQDMLLDPREDFILMMPASVQRKNDFRFTGLHELLASDALMLGLRSAVTVFVTAPGF